MVPMTELEMLVHNLRAHRDGGAELTVDGVLDALTRYARGILAAELVPAEAARLSTRELEGR